MAWSGQAVAAVAGPRLSEGLGLAWRPQEWDGLQERARDPQLHAAPHTRCDKYR